MIYQSSHALEDQQGQQIGGILPLNSSTELGEILKPGLVTQGYLFVQWSSPFTNTLYSESSSLQLAPTSKATCVTGHADAEKLSFLSQLHVEQVTEEF